MRNWRVNFVFVIFILFSATITSRLFYLQIIKKDLYRALAQGQQKTFQYSNGERGKIFLKDGHVLATNIKSKIVTVSPGKIEKKDETAKLLTEVLKLDQASVSEVINNNTAGIIKKDATEEEEKSLNDLKIPGISVQEVTLRKYPYGSVASQVVGFLGGEGAGQYGLEGYYDELLRGKECFQEKERGTISYFLSDSSGMSCDGSDIFLTIDYNIQLEAEKILKEAKEKLNIEGGTIIVMDPNSGEIIALANSPDFDPNNYSQAKDFSVFQDGAVQKFYEPGSVFKSITMAAALDAEKVTPNTIYVDNGSVKIGNYTIFNYAQKTWGEQTMTRVLEQSINTGAIFAERQIGHEIFTEYVKKFGFLEPTSIDLQGEIFSENKRFQEGYEVNFANAAFGQGIEVTPIQMARAFCAIANGGKLVRPYVVDSISNGDKINRTEPKVEDRIISQKAASQLTAMLISVVENGSGRRAKIPGYYIAGKTGTSQVPWSAFGVNKKGYSERTWQSFVGFVPAFNAKFVILVKLDNPNAQTAEQSATPLFKEMSKYLLDYFEIPPDYNQ